MNGQKVNGSIGGCHGNRDRYHPSKSNLSLIHLLVKDWIGEIMFTTRKQVSNSNQNIWHSSWPKTPKYLKFQTKYLNFSTITTWNWNEFTPSLPIIWNLMDFSFRNDGIFKHFNKASSNSPYATAALFTRHEFISIYQIIAKETFPKYLKQDELNLKPGQIQKWHKSLTRLVIASCVDPCGGRIHRSPWIQLNEPTASPASPQQLKQRWLTPNGCRSSAAFSTVKWSFMTVYLKTMQCIETECRRRPLEDVGRSPEVTRLQRRWRVTTDYSILLKRWQLPSLFVFSPSPSTFFFTVLFLLYECKVLFDCIRRFSIIRCEEAISGWHQEQYYPRCD